MGTYVREDERLGWVKANGDDVLGVAAAVALDLLDGPLFGEEIPKHVSKKLSGVCRNV